MVMVLVVVLANQLQLMWIVQQCSAFEEQPPMEGTARAASFSWKCQQLFNPLLLNPTKTLCFGNSIYKRNTRYCKDINIGKYLFRENHVLKTICLNIQNQNEPSVFPHYTFTLLFESSFQLALDQLQIEVMRD